MNQIIIDANNYLMIALHVVIKNFPDQDKNFDRDFKNLLSKMFYNLQSKLGTFAEYYAVYDTKGSGAWRKEQNEEYKANRTSTPRLIEATELSREVFAENEVPTLDFPGAEADDIIHAMCEVLSPKKKPTIVTRDKDLLQAVQRRIAKDVYDPVSKKFMEVPIYDIVLYKSLVGDSSDNIKGVPGIGPKRAKKLLSEGFDHSIIEETFPLVNIPSHPEYKKYVEYAKKFFEGKNKDASGFPFPIR